MAEDILKKIVAHKRIENAQAKEVLSLKDLIEKCDKSNNIFYQALEEDKTHFILECKKGSPSKGIINHDYRPAEAARIYQKYASAISVLTDEKFFFGSFDNLRDVREVTTTPLLSKDFVIDEYTIYRARFHGADAILLILEIITDAEYIQFSSVAHKLGMGVLTEIATEEQAERANHLGSKVVGINNRNLKDFSIDLQKTQRLAEFLTNNPVIISESGIFNHAQIRENNKKANGFLIGTSLMKEPDVDYACRKLIFGENKVCGVTSKEILQSAYKAGAAYAGLNFIESSPRYVNIDKAISLAKDSPLPLVGIFCDQKIEEVLSITKSVCLSFVQLHGNENAEYVNSLRKVLPRSCKIWKAITTDDKEFLNHPDIQYFIVDSKNPGQFGGTGSSFDWSLLTNFPKDRILLAGGIGPENAREASLVGCLGLDLNSKLENKDGSKDPLKINKAFAEIINY
jgi:indole-3-glycerol phosphate synthase/phosphoribosylanthranilate isomerase